MKHAPILHAALFTPMSGGRWGLPLLLWGDPGIAKTALVEALAAEWGLPCETLSPSERGEGAFGVVPVPVNGVLTYPRPEWTTRFDDGRGLVFVDEATTAAPALQGPIMGLIHARRIGGHTLHGGVRVLAAANPPEKAAGGFDLASALANRFGHLDVGAPTPEEHAAYMLGQSTDVGTPFAKMTPAAETSARLGGAVGDAADEEARVLKAWPTAWAHAAGHETAFLLRRPGLKNQCPDVGDPKAGRAWPSDRAWEHATRAWASARVHDLSPALTETFVASFLGEGVASELFAFVEEQDLPDPVKLLDGVETFSHNSKRLDRTLATLNACASLITPVGAAKRKERTAMMWVGLLEKLTEDKADTDILVPAVQTLINAQLHLMKEATKTLAKLQPVLKAAGVRPGKR